MSFSLRLTRDDVSPDLREKLAAAKSPEPVWRAAATEVVSITKRSFREPSLRIAPWAPKRDGTPSNLIAKGTLLSSIRVVSVNKDGAEVGTDRIYGAIHQVGGTIRTKNKPFLVFKSGGKTWRVKSVKMPPRPFFPFTPDGQLAAKHQPRLQAIIDAAMRLRLGIQ